MAGLGELFIELGVFADTKELEQAEKRLTEFVKTGQKAINKVNENIKANDNFQNKLKDVVKGVGAVIGALTAAGYALNRLTNDLVQSNQAMLNLTRTSDISLSTFQKWGSIGKMLGVNNAAQQLEGLNQRLFELRLTGQGARGFQLAGINPTGDADAVMEQLRTRVSGMSDTSASYLLREMGLDPQMLHLLRMGREEFEELGQTIKKYQLTEDQRADIQKMNIQLEIARQKLQYLKDRAILAIMPYWVRFVKVSVKIIEILARAGKAIGKFVVKWRGLIAGLAIGASKFIKLERVIKRLLLPFRNMQAVLLKTLRLIPQIGPGLARAAAGFLRFGAVINKALLPLIAAFLILDDFAVYKSGGDSVIGDFMDWKNQQGEDWNTIGQTFQSGDTVQGLKDVVIKLIVTIDDFVQEMARWLHVLTGLPFDKWADAFAKFMSNNTIDKARNYDFSHGQATGGAAGISSNGYEGRLPALEHKNAVSPATEQAINNSSVSNNSNSTTTLSMNNYFNTNQPAYDIERELRYVTAQFA